MRILIIEDEFTLADVIATKLKKEKFLVDISLDGEEGLYQSLTGIYDLIILDVMLPKIDGFTILKEIRNKNINSKVIMLTAKSTLNDKLDGLENGANDYITKPFHIEELLARINIQLKDPLVFKNNIITFSDLELDISKSELKCLKTNESVILVCKELQLLEYFFNNPKIILSKEQLYDRIWGIETEIESNNLEVYLSFIRRKLKALGTKVNIKSVRGLGYKMEEANE